MAKPTFKSDDESVIKYAHRFINFMKSIDVDSENKSVCINQIISELIKPILGSEYEYAFIDAVGKKTEELLKIENRDEKLNEIFKK